MSRRQRHFGNRELAYTITKVHLDSLVHLQGVLVRACTPNHWCWGRRPQPSFAPSQHTGFTLVDLHQSSALACSFTMRKEDIGLVGKRENRFCDHGRDGEQFHLWACFYVLTFTPTYSNIPKTSGVPRNFLRGGFNKFSWGQRERGSGGGSRLVGFWRQL